MVRALTGTDPDTLPEEKERGMTIELGFVFLPEPGPRPIVFIDVPGHERFIRTMVAGASTIDAVLFVIAADEGIEQQTREHLAILGILGIARGIVLLNKSDLIDDEQLAQRRAETRALLSGTPLADAAILSASAKTGAGIPELAQALRALAAGIGKPDMPGQFRLPVDRVFSMKGFGTVVAGTVLSGSVAVGDELFVYPEEHRVRVRGLQVNHLAAARAAAGQRTAVNLQDIDKEQLYRGQMLAPHAAVAPTLRADVAVRMLPAGVRLKHRERVRVHCGTAELLARVALLADDELKGGEAGPAQLLFEQPAAIGAGDRFVLRALTPVHTLGGGVILDPLADAHKRRDPAVLAGQAALAGEPPAAVRQLLAGADGLAPAALALRLPFALRPELPRLLAALATGGEAVQLGELWYARAGADALRQRALARVRGETTNAELLSGLELPKATAQAVLDGLLRDGTLARDGERLYPRGAAPQLPPVEAAAAERIMELYARTGLAAPAEEDAAAQLRLDPALTQKVIAHLRQRGQLVRLAARVTWHRDILAAAREQTVALLRVSGKATAAEVRDELGVARKHAVALLEYLDEQGVTVRVGDRRTLL